MCECVHRENSPAPNGAHHSREPPAVPTDSGRLRQDSVNCGGARQNFCAFLASFRLSMLPPLPFSFSRETVDKSVGLVLCASSCFGCFHFVTTIFLCSLALSSTCNPVTGREPCSWVAHIAGFSVCAFSEGRRGPFFFFCRPPHRESARDRLGVPARVGCVNVDATTLGTQGLFHLLFFLSEIKYIFDLGPV